MGVCRGLDDLVEIKISDRTAWSGSISATGNHSLTIDQPNLFGGDKSEGGISGDLIIMRGTNDQQRLSQLQAMYGEDVPAYRGVTTFFYDGLICSNSPYPKPWSLRTRRTNADWDGGIWYQAKLIIWLNNNTIKAMNPAHILYQVQTDRVWGRGYSASQLDLTSFQSAADQLFNENFGLCLGWRRQNSLNEFIQEILNTIGAALFVDRMTGLWKLVLIRDNYDVSSLQNFNYTNGLLEITEDNNSSSDLVSNQIVVSYRDPITNEDKTAYSENIAAIQTHGVILENKSYAGIPTSELAGRIAARDLKVAQSSLKRFKLVFDRRAYTIQPVSVFKINVPEQGIESIVVRAIRVDHDNITNGKITITVIQDVFGLPSTNYVSEQVSLYKPPDHTAQLIEEPNFKFFNASYYDMCSQFSDGESKKYFQNWNYYAAIAKAPNQLHLMFKMWIRQRFYDPNTDEWNDSGFQDCCTVGNFAPVGTLLDFLPHSYSAINVRVNISTEMLKVVKANTAALVNNEIVRIDAIDIQSHTITLSRGCADSIVSYHGIDSEIWFYDEAVAVSSIPWYRRISPQYSNIIYYKFQTFTRYDETSAPNDVYADAFSISFYASIARAYRPYPPAHVLCQNKVFSTNQTNYIAQPFNLITWRNRNRLEQADRLYSQADASIDIEDGCYTELAVSLKNLEGGFISTEYFNLGAATSVDPVSLIPNALNHRGANFLLRTRNGLTGTLGDPSINAYSFDIEFFGFGVNFGRHFGEYNG
ncbi:hypothetical protein [Acinetobacter puyangensis]|uniref:hypothetical protein n=1 Tax=Acinetobacter puyangensis TaxID=1096779 RepID=UPI003A4D7713